MKLIRWLILIFSLFFHQIVFAAAYQFYELGAPINGTAGVGQAAVASDASTAYYNPAGMALLSSTQFLLGTQMILPYTNFSPGAANTIRGNNGSNAGTLVPGADYYFVYSATPKLKFGASVTSPYGGALNYEDHWVGRFFVQQMVFYTLNLNPAVAYQINNWIALGGGVAIEYANLFQNNAIPLTDLADGQVTMKGDNTAFGFNLGVMLTPSCKTRIGVAYRSQILHNLRGNLSFFNINIAPSATTRLVSPANVIASISQDVSENFTVLGEAGWAHWSAMNNIVLDVSRFTFASPQRWRDTYRLGLGAQFRCQNFLVQAGVSYDSSPTTSSRRTPNLPMDRQIRAGAGLEYGINEVVQLGVSYEYLNLGKAAITNSARFGTLSGSYSRNYANVIQVSLNVGC